jgi:hypothetical protein
LVAHKSFVLKSQPNSAGFFYLDFWVGDLVLPAMLE